MELSNELDVPSPHDKKPSLVDNVIDMGLEPPSSVTSVDHTPTKSIQSAPMDSVDSKNASSKKRKSLGGLKVKASSISPKVPVFLAKNSKGGASYFTLVHEAIVELNDRTGSSIPAIMKFLKNKHPELEEMNPNFLQSSINNAIKTGIKENKLVKIKASYKINREWLNKEKNAFKSREAKKKAAEKKKKEASVEKKKENMKVELTSVDKQLMDATLTSDEREDLELKVIFPICTYFLKRIHFMCHRLMFQLTKKYRR
jgi:hypothetical protein